MQRTGAHNKNKIPVTVVVPVKNEQTSIAQCLEKLGPFETVVVIDSDSTDRTIEIAEKYPVEIINFKWSGQYPKKRNWFLLSGEITTEWVLFVDADEFLTTEFCDELQAELANSTKSGYWINYRKYYFGKMLKHGVRQKKIALFKAGAGLYEKLNETNSNGFDMEIHEHPIIQGDTGVIKSKIDHVDNRGLANLMEKHVEYAQWECDRLLSKMQKAGGETDEETFRQSLKNKYMGMWWFGTAYFILDYIICFGFLDGASGFRYARLKKWYFETIRLLLLEKRNGK